MLPRLGQLPPKKEGFQGWITSGSYQPIISADSSTVTLKRINFREIVPYISFDFERFALSSRETFVTACTDNESIKLAGWPLLKLYYAAFFAAHAIMRSMGAGVILISKIPAQHLNSILNIYDSNAPALVPGMFMYRLLRYPTNKQPSVVLEQQPRSKGVHESFWLIFCDFLLSEAKLASQVNSADSVEFLTGVSEISDVIRSGSSGVWLSTIRNEINYQHKHGVWFPIKRNSSALAALQNVGITDTASIRLDISKQQNPILAFANISRYLACLNIEVSEFVAKRSTAGGAFGQKWRRLSQAI